MTLTSILALKALQADENLGTGELIRKQDRSRPKRQGSEKELFDKARKDWKELDKIKATAPPVGWFETYGYMAPIPTFHPPSLKNPQKVKQIFPQTGWQKGATKEERRQAIQDLVEQHKRVRRQIGKPEISRTADFPMYPSIEKWL